MSVPEYITWRALGGTCGDDVSEEILENSQNWETYDIRYNLWAQMLVAPLIVILNLYIFLRIVVGNDNLRKTFGAVAFQAIVDVVFTGTALIIHDMLYIVYDGKPLMEGGLVKLVYTFSTASYNINAFNTSAILAHLALDRFLTVRLAHIPDSTHNKFKHASFTLIAIFTSYCLWITVVHSTYLQLDNPFEESGPTLKKLYHIFWYEAPSLYIITWLYILVVVSTSILYSCLAYMLLKQTKSIAGRKMDKKMKRNKEITLLFFLSTVAYVLLWFPEVSYAFFWQWRKMPCLYTQYFKFKYSSRFGFFMDWARELLFYIYSVVNPLLFIGTQKNFHLMSFKQDLMKKFGRKWLGVFSERANNDTSARGGASSNGNITSPL
ncbi:uncharacterized protein LOC134855550 isoform X2 [Symsagittifera roscoffensis]